MSAPDIDELIRQAEALEQSARAHASAAGDPHRDRSGLASHSAQLKAQDAAQLRARIQRMEAKRKADLSAIHASAKTAGVDEDTRRAMVERISGGRTRSSADLTVGERTALLREMGGPKRPSRAGRAIRPAAMDRQSMIAKVNAQLADQRLPTAYAEAILRRQRGIADKDVACPIEAATDPELRGVIAALYRRSKPSAPRR